MVFICVDDTRGRKISLFKIDFKRRFAADSVEMELIVFIWRWSESKKNIII